MSTLVIDRKESKQDTDQETIGYDKKKYEGLLVIEESVLVKRTQIFVR